MSIELTLKSLISHHHSSRMYKLSDTFESLYLYDPDEGRLQPKCGDCTTYNDFELYIYTYMYVCVCICVLVYLCMSQFVNMYSRVCVPM